MENRAAYIEFIEHLYFGNVANGDVERVMDCFVDNAKVVIRHGDLPEQRFASSPRSGQDNLLNFYQHLCDNYTCRFGNFQHTIDINAKRAASRFCVRLNPRPDGIYSKFPVQQLSNCNFFEFANGGIKYMLIYYANSANGDDEKPTGYPKT